MPHIGRSSRSAGVAAVGLWVGIVVLIVLGWDATLDGWLHSWVLDHRTGAAVRIAIAVTTLGLSGVTVPTVIVTAAVVTPGGLRSKARCVLVAAALALGAVVCRYGLSVLIGRDRPPRQDWAYHASGFAFPSGHSADAAVAAGMVGWLVATRLRPRVAGRRLIWGLAVGYAVAVGATRVYLGVHWPTDVLGGWLFAAAWLAGAAWLIIRIQSWVGPRCGARSSVGEGASGQQREQGGAEQDSIDDEGGEGVPGDVAQQPRDRGVGHDEGHHGPNEHG